jgi:competence protein ComEA
MDESWVRWAARIPRWVVVALAAAALLGAALTKTASSNTDARAVVTVERTKRAAAQLIVVDVSGAVRRPGVYEMPKDARVRDVISRAGGLRRNADVSGVNRAAPVVDGQQVVVPQKGAAGGAGVATAPAGGAAVSINAADLAQLDELPGIGPATAQKIIDDRTRNGPFASVDDLDRVSGIGPATIEELRPLVTL